MGKKSRIREYEKNNRIINIPRAQKERRERLESQKEKLEKKTSKKNVKNKNGYLRLIAILAIIFVIVYLIFSYMKIHSLREEQRIALERNQALIKTKEELELKLEQVTSKSYIEALARRDLKLVKPNELIFIYPENMEIEEEDTGGKDKD